jgi:hypothetical protein
MLKIIARTLIVLAAALIVSGILYLVTPASATGPQRGPRPGGDQTSQQAPPQRRPDGGRGGGNWSLAAAGRGIASFATISVITGVFVLLIRVANGRKLATVHETGAES